MKDYYQPLYPNTFYHIFNRGNNRENLFYLRRNYHYFLTKYDHYLSDYLETYAFCLLPNHFHLLVKVKDKIEICDAIAWSDSIAVTRQISEQFRRFFISYSQAINKQEGRTGSLFQKQFKRLPVTNQRYLKSVIYYIHANPQYHGIATNFKSYPYSSYFKMLVAQHTKLKKKEVIQWFGSSEQYRVFHQIQHKDGKWDTFMIEN